MAKLKVMRESFGIIPNSVLNNKKLSFKAKGIYGYIQSKPDGWDFSSERIAMDSGDGRDSVRAGLRELEDAGFLERKQVTVEHGYKDVEYTLYENPVTVNPETENPSPENPTPEKPSPNKYRNSNKEISNKETSNKAEQHVFADVPLDSLPKLGTKLLEFSEYRKQIKAPIRSASVPAFLKKLAELSNGSEEQACEILDQSIANGWRGIFELKKAKKEIDLVTFY